MVSAEEAVAVLPSQRDRARTLLAGALRRGDLVRPAACEDCGAEGLVQGHHPDYSKPLEVEWLCASCHRTRPRLPMAHAAAPDAEYLSLTDLTDILGVSRRALNRMLTRGLSLYHIPGDRKRYVRVADLAEFFTPKPIEPKPRTPPSS